VARRPSRRGRVILVAMTSSGTILEENDLSVDEYYDGRCEMIDSREYRCAKGITLIKGEVYDLKGALDPSFENGYYEAGDMSGSRTVFADGQVVER
jgi:hypothetical protein